MSTVENKQEATVTVERIGGIDETTLEIPPGVTVLAGRNATNRTSFLQAIKAILGSTNVSLKGDADQGNVRLEFRDETYERTLTRTNGHITFSGDPLLDDPTIADLFAFLLESNECRRTIARAGNLQELIMRPIDVGEINAEIERLKREKGGVNESLAEIESLKQDLPELERKRSSLREEIEDTQDQLEAKEEEIDESSAEIQETREMKDALNEKLTALSDTRTQLERVRQQIESTDESITSLQREQNELATDLDDVVENPMEGHDVEDEITRLRDRKRRFDQEVQELQSVIQFNEEMLDEDETSLLDAQSDDGALTDQLVADDGIACWTCGSEVTASAIDETIDTLRSIRSEKLQSMTDLDEQLRDLQTEQRKAERQLSERKRLEERQDEIEGELEQRQDRLDELHSEKETLTDEVEQIEEEVDTIEPDDFGDVLDHHKEANQLEFELGRLETDLGEVKSEIEDAESQIEREDGLIEQREELLDELEHCRNRIRTIETDAVEAFNSHMDTILDLLEYDNLDRIWIEQREETVRDGRENVQQSTFDLHVVRSTESGAAYEDTVDHLSESEREVTGFIFALAGYLVHDVHEKVPFMLLDSLEALDSNRIATLVDYLEGYASYLVVALLPEDAQALDGEYTRVSEV